MDPVRSLRQKKLEKFFLLANNGVMYLTRSSEISYLPR